MIDDTINGDKTVAGGGKDVTLAGRYHIIRQLGQGGMGAVWLAEDQQLDNRKVAIKMLPTIIVQDKRAYKQLKGEALVSLKLIHPNIVTLRAFEENDGAPFLVMDYIEGRTLNDYIAIKGKLGEEETIKLLKPIAAALDYAHGEKVVHRDIKPSNILIRNDGHPFILDFGIAREIQESMTRMTGGTISGTLLYMAPEQLRGAPPKPAQDVYSFSAMAYECLSGQPPFIRGQIEYQIINEKPAPLPGGSRFVSSIMAGLAKKPEDRPKSCSAVLGRDDFSRAEYVESVERVKRASGRIDFGSRKANKGGGTNKTLWVIGAVIAVAVIAALCWGVPAYNKSKSTTKFLKYVDAKWYDNIAQMIDKIDVSDARVQFALGELYFNGNGVAKNEETAIRWYCKAAEQGNRYAQRAIERINMERELEAEAERKAQEENRRKAENAERLKAEAKRRVEATRQFLVACGEMKYEDAAKLIKSIDCDDAEVQFNLGMMYANGNGVEKDDREAFNWCNRAAVQGNSQAQALIGEMYDDGTGVAKDEAEAAKWYRKAADQGHAGAQNNLAWKYQYGRGVIINNDEAMKWYCKAADQGNATAQNNLGRIYQEGVIVKKDCKEAVRWYRKAAEQGKANAQYNLGRMYVHGSGVKKDDAEAVKWYRKAAEQGDSDAQYNLGIMYACGNGVGKDEGEAIKWYGRAAEQGHVNAKRFKECLQNMDTKGHKSGEAQTIKLPGGATMEMIYCAPGTFMMGTPESEFPTNADYEKLHFVLLTKGFWLGKYEVTQKQWRSVMWYNHSHFKGDDLPVESVSWKECQNFIKKVNEQLNCGARLPTEAEWEYACRAGTTGAYGGVGNIDDMGWYQHFGDIADTSRTYSADKDGHTYSVGLKKANDWGFYDMHGNVEEWCNDWIGDYAGDEIDPIGASYGRSRVHRGGSYFDWNVACRSASRPIETGFPDSGMCTMGFRLVCSEIPQQHRVEGKKDLEKLDEDEIKKREIHTREAKKSLEVLERNSKQPSNTKPKQEIEDKTLLREALDVQACSEMATARSAMKKKDWDTAYRKYSLAFKHLSDNKDTTTLRKECAQGMAEARYQAGRQTFRSGNFQKAREYMYEARKLGHPRAQAYIDYFDRGGNK